MKKYIKDIVSLCSKSVLFWTGLFLAFIAIFHGLRLDDDAYSHFAISVETIQNADFVMWLTDTWNKPMTTLVYGLVGQLGIIPARLISVTLVLLSAFLLVDLLHLVFGWSKHRATWLVVAAYIFQISLLPQVFLTNTEQLAAVLLVVGYWLRLARKQSLMAGICIGFVVWARMEAAFLAAGVILGFLADSYKTDMRKSLHDFLVMGFGAAIPPLAWWIAATWVSNDPFWFRAGYVYVREPFFQHLLSVNFLTGLPGALSAPLLLMVCSGIFAVWRRSSVTNEGITFRWTLLLPILLQGLFLSVMTVYPKGSEYGGWAIASLNARSYNILSPLFCLLAAAGYLHLKGSRRWLPSIGITVLLLIGYFYFQGAFPFLFGPFLRYGYLGLGVGLLIAFVLLQMLIRHTNEGRRLVILSLYLIISAPMMVPFFWYPLRSQDVREETQQKFARWYLNEFGADAEAPIVLQSVNGRLDYLGGLPEGATSWLYPAQLSQAVERYQGKDVLVLVEALPDGAFLSAYPAGLKAQLDASGFKELIRFIPVRGNGRVDRLILLMSPRNAPVALAVYASEGYK